MGDICLPGCFAARLEAHKEAGTMPAMLMSHDQDRKANILEVVSLGEVSFVALAANSQAKITSVKTLSTVRDYERALRTDYGLSSREARKLVTGGWKAYQPGYETEQKQIADLIRTSAHKFGV